MKKCENCNVHVYDDHTHCPLCKAALGAGHATQIAYPKYAIKQATMRVFLLKLALFVSISTALVAVFINIFTYDIAPYVWSTTVFVCIAFVWGLVAVLKAKGSSKKGKMLDVFFLLCAFLFFLDLFNGFLKWSTNYALPWLIVAMSALFMVLALSNKNTFNEYCGYLITIALVSFAPIIMYATGLSDRLWASLITALTCVIMAAGTFIFAEKHVKAELKKKFHF